MKDDDKNSNHEYQYPESEYVVDGETHPAEEHDEQQSGHAALPRPDMNMLLELWRSNKRIIIITGIAIFVALLFKLFSGHETEKAQAPVVVEPVQQPMDASLINNQGNVQVQSALNAASQNKAAIDELHNELEQLKSAVDGMNSAQAQFSNTLGMLSDQINQIQTALQPKPAAVKKQPVVVPITYYLRAVVPGRAWIQGTDGSSRSVAVGDVIKQYGAVQSIDAENGLVVTSSGKTIGFNSDDS